MDIQLEKSRRCKCSEKQNCNDISSLKWDKWIPPRAHTQIRAWARFVSKGGYVPLKQMNQCLCVSWLCLGLQNCCTLTWPTSGCFFPPDLGMKFVHTVSVLSAGGREVWRVPYLVWGVYFIDGMSKENKAVNMFRQFFF